MTKKRKRVNLAWPDLNEFAWPDLNEFEWPDLREFEWPDLREFEWPDLREFEWPDLAVTWQGWPKGKKVRKPANPGKDCQGNG